MAEFNISEALYSLKKMLQEEIHVHKRQHIYQAEEKSLISDINNYFITDYQIQRRYIPDLLTVYEDTADHLLSLQISDFLNGLEDLKTLPTMPLDLSFWDNDIDIDIVFKEFKTFLEIYLVKGHELRLSNDTLFVIDNEKGGRFLRLVHKLISHQSINQNLKADDITGIILQLWAARNIAIAIERKELFYFLVSIFLDGLHFRQNYQFARDIAEECLICSYKDDTLEYGYYLSFKVFGSTSSAITALHYANIANMIFKRRGIINDYVLKNYYWEAIKFLRNIKLIPFAISLFEKRPLHVPYSQYELNKFYNAYFSTLLFTKDKNLPDLVLSYIDKSKELIIQTGEHEALPWLAMLFNVKKNYSIEEYDETQLLQYQELFKRIVSKSNYDKIHNSLFGTLEQLMKELKKNLLSLTFTRSQSDFVTDNKVALDLSHRNILKSFEEENVEGYLLSMILQSDFSIIFKEKYAKLLSSVEESYISKQFEKEYYTPEFFKDFILNQDFDILWLGTDNHKIAPLFFTNGKFSFLNDKERNLIDAFYYSRDAIKHLPLSTRTNGRISSEKLYEDYYEEEKQIKKDVEFFNLPIQPIKPVLIIKDIELSSFPHNLISTEIDLLSNLVPVSNIMSLEYFLFNNNNDLGAISSKAIWIPIKSQDMPLFMMYSKIEEDLSKFNVKLYDSIIPETALNSDINILVAHGNEKISTFPAFYLNSETESVSILNFDNIVGTGKILILFICHSGSERSDLLRNQTITIIKQFLQNGYQTVIAPFWALHIDIPPIWLPEFFEHLNNGNNVGNAFFNANKKVAKVFNTPNAYSCLHLYGNPFIKLHEEKVSTALQT